MAAVIKGGYEVTVGGLRGFCPFSQMDLRRVDTTEEYVGRVLEFRVTTFSENGRNLVLSRRRLLEERAAEAAEETRKKIAPGRGAGRDGRRRWPTSARSSTWAACRGSCPCPSCRIRARAVRPISCASATPVTVKVLRVDQEKGRISLSLKALEGDPWARGGRTAARAPGRAGARGPLDRVRRLRRAPARRGRASARHRDSAEPTGRDAGGRGRERRDQPC